jgi:hypothetical protein
MLGLALLSKSLLRVQEQQLHIHLSIADEETFWGSSTMCGSFYVADQETCAFLTCYHVDMLGNAEKQNKE